MTLPGSRLWKPPPSKVPCSLNTSSTVTSESSSCFHFWNCIGIWAAGHSGRCSWNSTQRTWQPSSSQRRSTSRHSSQEKSECRHGCAADGNRTADSSAGSWHKSPQVCSTSTLYAAVKSFLRSPGSTRWNHPPVWRNKTCQAFAERLQRLSSGQAEKGSCVRYSHTMGSSSLYCTARTADSSASTSRVDNNRCTLIQLVRNALLSSQKRGGGGKPVDPDPSGSSGM
mmetsp:Transcript_31405/g.80719  ORF Transcript_31405/g.80719 Transcript_31405/m.80719 type:complete len:226 (-) Transcript_31405:148-825(-)